MKKVGHTSEFPIAIYWWASKKPEKSKFWKNEKKKKFPGDIIILHMCTKNHNHMRYSSWNTKRDRIFCHFGSFLTLLPPPTLNSPKKWKFQKNKNKPDDIIILHKCTKNHDHMLYYAWDMAHDRCNYFSFCAIFCPLTPLTAQKMKISKKWKKYLEISSFYTSVPKVIIICYTVPEIWRVTDVTVFVFFHFRQFFALLPL